MKIFLTLIFGFGLLFSKQFGLVLSETRGMEYDQTIIADVQNLMAMQNDYYELKNNVEVIIDKNANLKRSFARDGSQSIVDFALEKKWDTIVLVDYKKSIQVLQFKLIVADAVQDRKSSTVIYQKSQKNDLASVLLTNLLQLNYQLGVFNVKDLY